MDAHLETRERRPQFVRGGGDELRLEPADLAQVRDVFEQRHGAHQVIVGVAHGRRPHAERALGAVNGPGQHGPGALRRHGPLRPQHIGDGLCDADVARHLIDGLSGGRLPRTKQSFGGGVRSRHPTIAVGDDHRVVERVDGGFGGLLRDEKLAEIRSPQFANPLGHPIEPVRQPADLVTRFDVDDRVEVSRGDAGDRGGQLLDRGENGIRQPQRSADPDHDERRGQRQRVEEPSLCRLRRVVGLPAHRLLVEIQQAVAVILDRAEARFEHLKVLGGTVAGRAQESVQPLEVVVTAAADCGNHVRFADLRDVALRLVERRVEARPVFRRLPNGALVLADQLEQSGRVEPFEALFHGFGRDHRIVVLGDDSAGHAAHRPECLSAPGAEHAERQHESEIPDQKLGAELHPPPIPQAARRATARSPWSVIDTADRVRIQLQPALPCRRHLLLQNP